MAHKDCTPPLALVKKSHHFHKPITTHRQAFKIMALIKPNNLLDIYRIKQHKLTTKILSALQNHRDSISQQLITTNTRAIIFSKLPQYDTWQALQASIVASAKFFDKSPTEIVCFKYIERDREKPLNPTLLLK